MFWTQSKQLVCNFLLIFWFIFKICIEDLKLLEAFSHSFAGFCDFFIKCINCLISFGCGIMKLITLLASEATDLPTYAVFRGCRDLANRSSCVQQTPESTVVGTKVPPGKVNSVHVNRRDVTAINNSARWRCPLIQSE